MLTSYPPFHEPEDKNKDKEDKADVDKEVSETVDEEQIERFPDLYELLADIDIPTVNKNITKQKTEGQSAADSGERMKADRQHGGISTEDDKPKQKTYHDEHPLIGLAEAIVVDKLSKGELPSYQLPETTSKEIISFLSRCFKIEQKERPTADELLADPFISGTCRGFYV